MENTGKAVHVNSVLRQAMAMSIVYKSRGSGSETDSSPSDESTNRRDIVRLPLLSLSRKRALSDSDKDEWDLRNAIFAAISNNPSHVTAGQQPRSDALERLSTSNISGLQPGWATMTDILSATGHTASVTSTTSAAGSGSSASNKWWARTTIGGSSASSGENRSHTGGSTGGRSQNSSEPTSGSGGTHGQRSERAAAGVQKRRERRENANAAVSQRQRDNNSSSSDGDSPADSGDGGAESPQESPAESSGRGKAGGSTGSGEGSKSRDSSDRNSSGGSVDDKSNKSESLSPAELLTEAADLMATVAEAEGDGGEVRVGGMNRRGNSKSHRNHDERDAPKAVSNAAPGHSSSRGSGGGTGEQGHGERPSGADRRIRVLAAPTAYHGSGQGRGHGPPLHNSDSFNGYSPSMSAHHPLHVYGPLGPMVLPMHMPMQLRHPYMGMDALGSVHSHGSHASLPGQHGAFEVQHIGKRGRATGSPRVIESVSSRKEEREREVGKTEATTHKGHVLPFTSRFRGVYWRSKAWCAQIQHSGRKLYLGTYETQEAAARAYDMAARKHHGSAALTNFDASGGLIEKNLVSRTGARDQVASKDEDGDESGKKGKKKVLQPAQPNTIHPSSPAPIRVKRARLPNSKYATHASGDRTIPEVEEGKHGNAQEQGQGLYLPRVNLESTAPAHFDFVDMGPAVGGLDDEGECEADKQARKRRRTEYRERWGNAERAYPLPRRTDSLDREDAYDGAHGLGSYPIHPSMGHHDGTWGTGMGMYDHPDGFMSDECDAYNPYPRYMMGGMGMSHLGVSGGYMQRGHRSGGGGGGPILGPSIGMHGYAPPMSMNMGMHAVGMPGAGFYQGMGMGDVSSRTAASHGHGSVRAERSPDRLTEGERTRLETFVTAVMTGRLRVARSSLASELRAWVNPDASLDFFQRLVDKKRLHLILSSTLATDRDQERVSRSHAHRDGAVSWEGGMGGEQGEVSSNDDDFALDSSNESAGNGVGQLPEGDQTGVERTSFLSAGRQGATHTSGSVSGGSGSGQLTSTGSLPLSMSSGVMPQYSAVAHAQGGVRPHVMGQGNTMATLYGKAGTGSNKM